MTKRIAVTGATGFVGGHLLDELLSRGYHVSALTRKKQPLRDGVNWILGDLQNDDALNDLIKGSDTIINVAGLVKAKSLSDFMSANSKAVATLKSIVRKSSHDPLFIQISSFAAREPHLSDYANSKYEGEEILKIGDEIRWTVIRPPAIYGPGDTETLKIFKAIRSGFAVYPDNKNNRVSWIHVHDLCCAVADLIEMSNCENKIFEIDDGSDAGYSHEEFFATASQLLNKSPLKITVPKFLLKTIGVVNDLLSKVLNYAPMLSAKKINEICHDDWTLNRHIDFQKSGWTPKIKLREGLKETLDWYKNNEYI